MLQPEAMHFHYLERTMTTHLVSNDRHATVLHDRPPRAGVWTPGLRTHCMTHVPMSLGVAA